MTSSCTAGMVVSPSFFLVLLLSFVRDGRCLYFPTPSTKLTVHLDQIPPLLTRVTALLDSGDPAPAVYSVSSDVAGHPVPDSLLEVDIQGNVTWKERPTNVTNITAKVTAKFKDSSAETELMVSVLPALKDPCNLTIEEACFAEGQEFRVSEDSRHPVTLADLGPITNQCPQLKPQYMIWLQGKGGPRRIDNVENGVATLTGSQRRTLRVNPKKMKDDLRLTLECRLASRNTSKAVFLRKIPSLVRLPVVCPPSKRMVKSVAKGSHLLLSWMVVKSGIKAEVIQPPDKSPYFFKLVKYTFRTGLVNATLLLIDVTWNEDLPTKTKDLNISVAVALCPDWGNASCLLETWSTVTVGEAQPVTYPGEPVRLSPSPKARVTQPSEARSLPGTIVFRSVLPSALESPYRVTEVAGIVYLMYWDGSAYLSRIPGVLVEWSDKSQDNAGGLAWISVLIQDTNCSRTQDDWEICAESTSEKSCVSTCGRAATPTGRGTCQWRDSKQPPTVLTRNYSTCSTDLLHCPDRWCDPLEALDPVICSQDCTEHVTVGNMDMVAGRGIASATGVCTCDDVGKCTCGPVHKKSMDHERREDKKEQKQHSSRPAAHRELLHSTASYEPQICDFHCIIVLIVIGSSLSCILGTTVYFVAFRGCNFRKKGRQSTEYSGHALLPISAPEVRSPVEHVNTIVHQYEVDPKWEVPRSRLIVEECLGEGEFGRVLKATARDLPGYQGFTTVAVKTLKENAGSSEMDDLMSEYQLLKEVSHPNVIKLLGACTSPGGPVYIIIEFCGLGSLRAYLRRHRNINTNCEPLNCIQKLNEITPREVLSFAWQISKGMAYLTEIKLVHRDLAARNILLATGKVCKISDFGLTRDVYEDDTYLKKSRGRVPVKWMAPESLSDHIYTSKSDVWSFGIVLWELVTLGSSPYPGIAVQNLYHLLKSGYRMQRPHNCSDHLYEIMKECWSSSPSERPSFTYLVDKFERMLEDGSDYLDCNVKMVMNPAYFASDDNQGMHKATGNSKSEMDIIFTMDLKSTTIEEEDTSRKKYENELVNKDTSYDVPKPISCIVMSDLLMKDEHR